MVHFWLIRAIQETEPKTETHQADVVDEVLVADRAKSWSQIASTHFSSERRLDLVVHRSELVHPRTLSLTAAVARTGLGTLPSLNSERERVMGSTRHLRNVGGRQRRDPNGDWGAD